jgi:hypothetical protein
MTASWLKSGAESENLAKKHEAAQKAKQDQQGKAFRFWLNYGEEARITFVDGELDENGLFNPPRVVEHNCQMNGSWNNYFVCQAKSDPDAGHVCPICEGGDNPSLLALFTVIDHRVVPSKKEPGKTYTDTVKLLAAKPQTFEILKKLALKRGGLAGCTFDVSRIGDKAAAVGSMFDFISKEDDLDVLRQKYVRKWVDKEGQEHVTKLFVPLNYAEQLVAKTEAELRAMGFGKSTLGGATKPANSSYAAQL